MQCRVDSECSMILCVSRNRSAKHYRHRASPDCNTVASFDSSGSESRGGLNRYYRQAWENLHQTAGAKAPLQRKETLDEPPKRYHNLPPPARAEGLRDGSELVITDVVPPKPSAIAAAEKKRHHHHHHHHHGGGEWRQQPHGRPMHKNSDQCANESNVVLHIPYNMSIYHTTDGSNPGRGRNAVVVRQVSFRKTWGDMHLLTLS
ncbi:hypothetical protein PR048_010341 [Dryococelus australis]|uniref:Uncharacterized protein n=1 Tax=Dryococelus australis TaxID=614101 RepID=A0ABQ9I2J6_9NEOP|nr:hypothetical protein PR048_010341 [Dryococelus australis]